MSDNQEYSQSGGLSFHTGLNYTGLHDRNAAVPGMPDQLLPGEDGSSNMGAESMPVGLSQGMDSQQVHLFNDPMPTTNNESQWDSMEDVPNDRHVEVLLDDEMYAAQTPPLFPPVPETARPLIEQDR